MRKPYRGKAISRKPIIFKELVGKWILSPDENIKYWHIRPKLLIFICLVRGLRARFCAEQDSLVDHLYRFIRMITHIKGGRNMVNRILVVLSCISFIDGCIIYDPLISVPLQTIPRVLP